MIVSYNLKGVGDTLLIVVKNSEDKEVIFERRGDVACVMIEGTREVVAWNIFLASEKISDLEGSGQINLTQEQVDKLNEVIEESGFEATFEVDNSPKFVVGFVKECNKHEDSDHLNITKIEVDNGEELQIVCGASNIKQGLKVVVAKVGAMMPDGMIIWPGELRGVASFGMVCSARELDLPNAPEVKGILELPESAVVGSAFDFYMDVNA